MDLKDICTIETGIRGPAQLAVKLAKLAAKKDNPITDCVLIYFDREGYPGIAFTTMTPEELGELERFFRLVNDDMHRELWLAELDSEEE